MLALIRLLASVIETTLLGVSYNFFIKFTSPLCSFLVVNHKPADTPLLLPRLMPHSRQLDGFKVKIYPRIK